MNNVEQILSNYETEPAGVKANLYRLLNTGKLSGTGKLVILPVDQGSEHGPVPSFASNPPAFDPHYHFQLAIDAGLNGFAAPLGLIEAGADTFAGKIPTILKLNNSNSLVPRSASKDQAITGSVADALRLGCTAIGLTIYPGAPAALDMIEEARELIKEAKAVGLPTVIWSYPRDGDLEKEHETAIDVSAYAAHIAALLGAHIIKVKMPSSVVSNKTNELEYSNAGISIDTMADRVRHIKQSAFNGRRIVIFSGGGQKGTEVLFNEVNAIRDGGANGSIIGRNAFKRPKKEALKMLGEVIDLYLQKDA